MLLLHKPALLFVSNVVPSKLISLKIFPLSF